MFQNLLKTLLGGAGQAVQKISQVASQPKQISTPAPKPAPVIYSQLQSRPVQQSSTTNPRAQGYQVPNYVQQSSATNPSAAGYVAPTSSPSGGSIPSTIERPSIFRNSISSLLPKVYATDGSTPEKTSSTDDILKLLGGSIGQTYSGARQFLADKGVIGSQTGNFGALLRNIVNPHEGSWGGAIDLGASEFFSPREKGMGTGAAVNKLYDQFKIASNTNLNKNRNTDIDIGDEVNAIRTRQIEELKKSTGLGGTGGTGSAGGIGKSGNSADTFTDLRAGLEAVDADTNAKLDELWNQMASGQITEEEYRIKAAEAEQQANETVYNQLIANLESEVPIINAEFDTAKAQLEGEIPGQEALAEKAKTNATNVYGDVMRKMVLNKEASMGNLRNMFSSLGTAESSAFINKAGELERSTGNDLAASERELADKVTTIDSALNEFKTNVKNKVSELNLERLKQVRTVENNKSMTQAQKAAKISEINAQLYKDLVGIKQYHDQQTNAFITLKQQLVANSGDLIKNAMVSDSLYNRVKPITSYDSGVGGNGNTRPMSALTSKKGVRQYDPITGKYYYLDMSTGEKSYV